MNTKFIIKNQVVIIILLLIILNIFSSCGYLSIIKNRLPPPHEVEGGILFQYETSSARIVTIAGSWPGNDWGGTAGVTHRYDSNIGRMNDEDGDGIWTIIVPLPPGRYEYKFVIDEHIWVPDPYNPERVEDGYGGYNSLLIVK